MHADALVGQPSLEESVTGDLKLHESGVPALPAFGFVPSPMAVWTQAYQSIEDLERGSPFLSGIVW